MRRGHLLRLRQIGILSHVAFVHTKPLRHPSLLPLVLSTCNLLISPGPYGNPGAVHTLRTRTDDERYAMEEIVVPFFISKPTFHSRPVGFLRPQVWHALQADDIQKRGSGIPSPWYLHNTSYGNTEGPWAVSFAPWVNKKGAKARTNHINSLLETWRDQGTFGLLMKGPFLCYIYFITRRLRMSTEKDQNEQYPIYFPPQEHSLAGTVAFTIERAALPLFGFSNFGCFLIGLCLTLHKVTKRNQTSACLTNPQLSFDRLRQETR
jgi:hypothetical protein